MPTINVAPVVMSDGTAITQYNDTVKGIQTFTFLTEQEAFTLKNKGTKDISYTVNAHTGTVVPSQSVSFTESITAFTLTTVSGTQAFEVRADQAGTSGVSNLAIASLDTKVTNLTTSLADKIDEVIKNGSIVTFKANGVILATFDLSVTANASLVQSYIDTLVSNGQIQGVTLANGAVTAEKTTFISKSAKRNRIDETTKQVGYRGNTSLGGKVADANYLFFEKVPIDQNTAYSVWCQNDDPTYYSYIQARYINFYDQAGTYLGSGTSLSSWLSSFTSPANAYFADISFNFKGKNFVLVPTTYKDNYLPNQALESGNLFVNQEQLKFLTDNEPKSLLSDSDFTSGFALNTINGTDIANANYKVSKFFPVKVGETYIIAGNNPNDLTRTLEGAKNIAFFDSGRTFALATSASSVYLKEFTAPSPIVWARIDTNINTSNIGVYTKADFEKLLNNILSDTIASFGDSLTAGTGGGGTSYSSVLEALTGIRVENYGIGGENVNTIAARQGGLVMLVNNITIPATRGTTVNIGTTAQGILCNNGKYAFPLLQGYGTFGGINNCLIAGVIGQIQNVGGVYQFSRYVTGTAVTINRPTPIITDIAIRKPYNKMVIWMGQNGGYDSTTDWIGLIKQMINFSGITDYIICGLTSGTSASRASEEKSFLDEFGRHYLNLRKYLSTPIYDTDGTTIKSSYGLEDAGVTATAQDITNITNGSSPISLRMDANDDTNVHFNASGYTVIGQQIYKRGQELGYW